MLPRSEAPRRSGCRSSSRCTAGARASAARGARRLGVGPRLRARRLGRGAASTGPLAREAFLGCLSLRALRGAPTTTSRRAPTGAWWWSRPTRPTISTRRGGARVYARWLVEVLVPRARRELPVLGDRAATGIDGVSLGGLVALETGFLRAPRPSAWWGRCRRRCSGAPSGCSRGGRRAPRARRSGCGWSRRGATPCGRPTCALHAALTARGVAHDWRVVEGPHDYVFNRGAGGVEMLRFHDRALRGEAAE